MVFRFPSAREVINLRQTMDRLMNESLVGSPVRTLRAVSELSKPVVRLRLPVDVYATAGEVVIRAAAPGLTSNDIELTWDRGTVTLHGRFPDVAQSDEGKSATWYRQELPTGTFQRTLHLPVDVDAERAVATFEHGMLVLRLPKAEAAKRKPIMIQEPAASGGSTTPAGKAEPHPPR